MRNALALVLAVSLTVFLVACEGKRGPAGPTGPAGPQGEPGEDATSNRIVFFSEEPVSTSPYVLEFTDYESSDPPVIVVFVSPNNTDYFQIDGTEAIPGDQSWLFDVEAGEIWLFDCIDYYVMVVAIY